VFLITGGGGGPVAEPGRGAGRHGTTAGRGGRPPAALGAETPNAGRAEDALTAVAEAIRSPWVPRVEILTVRDDRPERWSQIARAGECAAILGRGAQRPGSLAAWVAVQRGSPQSGPTAPSGSVSLTHSRRAAGYQRVRERSERCLFR
jgi:hypothetical protein